MTESEDDTKSDIKWRPLATGVALFAAIFALNFFVIEETVNVIGVSRALAMGGMSAWVTWLLYRNNALKRDVLTGLYRRLVAEEKLEQLRLARKDVTVGIIDVNGLRLVNNTHGHDAGDRLLREVGHRLSSHFTFSRIVVARLGGDEFIVIAEHKSQQELCDELTACLSRPHQFGDWYIAAAGVARSRSGLVRDALRCADRAMYRAKKTSANHALQYDCVLDGIPAASATLMGRPQNRLRDEAIDRQES